MEALVDCSLEVMEGEFIVVRGPSGSGKTTMLMTLGGMLHPSTGRVVVQGESIWERSEAWRAGFRANTIGFVFQDFHLLPYLTVRENIELAACTPGAGDRVDDQLEQLGLLDRSDHHPGELSVGERQRVALGRALINSPALLLADEPTGNLDPANAGRILGILESFQGDGGTVVLVTHSPLVPRTKHRVVQIEDGRIAGHDAAGVE